MLITLILILVIISHSLFIYDVTKMARALYFWMKNIEQKWECFHLFANLRELGLLNLDFNICFSSGSYTHYTKKKVLEQACEQCFQVEKPLENTHILLQDINLSK